MSGRVYLHPQIPDGQAFQKKVYYWHRLGSWHRVSAPTMYNLLLLPATTLLGFWLFNRLALVANSL